MVKRQDASTGQIVDDGVASAAPELTINGKAALQLKIYSPFQVYYDELALSFSGENATGPFDILPKHHNFVSLLNACELRVEGADGVKRIRISGGLMHVKADSIRVFLDV